MRFRRLAALLAVGALAIGLGTSQPAHATVTTQFGGGMGSSAVNGQGPDGCGGGSCAAIVTDSLNALAAVYGGVNTTNVPLVRTAFHWQYNGTRPGTAGTTSSFWDKYDAFVAAAFNRGVEVMPELHESDTGCSCYRVPTSMTDWKADVKAFADRYGPGGNWPSSGSHAVNKPAGFTGITKYDVWNEPNTPTGDDNNSGHDVTFSVIDNIEEYASSGIRASATANSWTSTVVGPALGAGDHATSCDSFVNYRCPVAPTASNGFLYQMDAAFGSSANPDSLGDIWNYIDVVDVHIYGSTINPNTCTGYSSRCINNLSNVESELTSEHGSAVKLAITEGGYSGHGDFTQTPAPQQCSQSGNDDIWDLQTQASYDNKFLSVANTNGNVAFVTMWNPGDQYEPSGDAHDCHTSSSDDSYWQSGIGLWDLTNDVIKPAGTTVQNDMASWYPAGDTTPPDTPTNLAGSTPVETDPTITWTDSTAPDVDHYNVYRNGIFAGSVLPGVHTYTDTATASPVTVLNDTCTRFVNLGGWGTPDTGGAYTLSSGLSGDFTVDGAECQMIAQAAGDKLSATQLSLNQSRDLDIHASFQLGALPTGTTQERMYLVARATDETNNSDGIRFTCDVNPNLSVTCTVREKNGSTTNTFGSSTPITAGNFGANNVYEMHAVVTGTNPTTLKLNFWDPGHSEPAFQIDTTDGGTPSVLQDEGVLQVRADAGTGLTTLPAVVWDNMNFSDTSPYSTDTYTVTAVDGSSNESAPTSGLAIKHR